jgi:HK97 family phage major capsid protein
MDEDQKAQQFVTTIKDGVVEQLMPKITDEIGKKFMEQKEMFEQKNKSADEELVEKKEMSAKLLRDLGHKKALSSADAEDGKELQMEGFKSEIIRLQPNYGVVRRNAQVIELSETITKYPTIGTADVSRVDEKGAIPVVSPTTGNVTFTLKKLAAIIPISNELLRRADISLVDWLSRIVAEGFGKAEDTWGILGINAGEGIFQNSDVPVLTLGSGKTTYASADPDDFSEMQDQLDDDAVEGAQYLMGRTVWNAMRRSKFVDSEGNNISYIMQNPAGGQPPTLWNQPIQWSRVMPRTTETAGLQADKDFAALANFDYMMLGDERRYEVMLSEHATVGTGEDAINLFAQDMVALRFIENIDIQLVEADKAFAILHTAAS